MGEEDLEGWGAVDAPEDFQDSDDDFSAQKQSANKKKKKGSGGFQVMGLCNPVYRGVIRKGYKVPTPIQRKTLPVILEGKDIVAMARTGSGKTACFLIPMFEKLLKPTHRIHSGPRALILSPTRELALQTLRFTKELGQYANLKAAVLLGGFSMEQQFAAIHDNPDIVIATPGRLVHVCVEMNMKFDSISYVVFDEADRLFEMGFSEQLNEILSRLPEVRQTLLFSATLPKMLVDFARAGLSNPVLIRLDVEHILSENLKVAYFRCNSEDRLPLLLHLLQNVLYKDEQSVIFAATSHHVEYLQTVLSLAGISVTYCYSALDPSARKINIAKFQTKKVQHFIVTDVAARGIDIPFLDNVINFNFPSKPKLFVHRVGRVARAGRSGVAYSFVAPDDVAYLQDLHMYLAKELRFAPAPPDPKHQDAWHDMYGSIPQFILDSENEEIRRMHNENSELAQLKRQMDNGYKQYVKCRTVPSKESVRRMKENDRLITMGQHPILAEQSSQADLDKKRQTMLQALKNLSPRTTIFEINRTSKDLKQKSGENMREKRGHDDHRIKAFQKSVVQLQQSKAEKEAKLQESKEKVQHLEQSTMEEVQTTFADIVSTDKRKNKKKRSNNEDGGNNKKMKENTDFKDKEFYMSYTREDHYKGEGNSITSSFQTEAKRSMLDMTQDNEDKQKQHKGLMKWDRKRKKFVGTQDQNRKIKTESGHIISATYKTDRYRKWLKRSKHGRGQSDDEDGGGGEERAEVKKGPRKKKGIQTLNHKGQKKYHPLLEGKIAKGKRPPPRELKNKQELKKAMKIREDKYKREIENRHKNELKEKKKLKQQRKTLISKVNK